MKKLIAISSFMIFSFALFAQSETDSTSLAVVRWNRTSYDLGRIANNQPVQVIFQFTNEGSIPLRIHSVQRGCNVTILEYAIAAIAPGGTGLIKVEYDAKVVGYFSKTIKVAMNTKNSITELFITGEVFEKL